MKTNKNIQQDIHLVRNKRNLTCGDIDYFEDGLIGNEKEPFLGHFHYKNISDGNDDNNNDNNYNNNNNYKRAGKCETQGK